MNHENIEDRFLMQITEYQTALRAYIKGSIQDHHDCSDVLQKTNLILFKKADQWQRDTPFLKWAFTVAKYEILAYYRDKSREKVLFNDDVLELVLEDSEKLAPELSGRAVALSQCLQAMPQKNQELLSYKYVARQSTKQIAQQVNRSSDGVRSLLKRLRSQLKSCIDQQSEAKAWMTPFSMRC